MDSTILFHALADATRQRALGLLTRSELSVSELVELLRLPQSTVSRQLKTLRQSGLVRDRRNGQAVVYSANLESTDGAGLASRLLQWSKEQPLAPGLEDRLRVVIERRREMSDRFFTRMGRHWDRLREESFGNCFHLEAFIALLPTDWRVADVGTGTGFLLPGLARQFAGVVGIDPVAEMLDTARRRVAGCSLKNVELRAGDLSQLPMNDGDVDLAVAVLVLHHTPSPAQAVGELARIVRHGGRVLIVEQLEHRSEEFRKRMHDRRTGFNASEAAAMLKGAGFDKVRTNQLQTVERADDAPALFVATGFRR